MIRDVNGEHKQHYGSTIHGWGVYAGVASDKTQHLTNLANEKNQEAYTKQLKETITAAKEMRDGFFKSFMLLLEAYSQNKTVEELTGDVLNLMFPEGDINASKLKMAISLLITFNRQNLNALAEKQSTTSLDLFFPNDDIGNSIKKVTTQMLISLNRYDSEQKLNQQREMDEKQLADIKSAGDKELADARDEIARLRAFKEEREASTHELVTSTTYVSTKLHSNPRAALRTQSNQGGNRPANVSPPRPLSHVKCLREPTAMERERPADHAPTTSSGSPLCGVQKRR